VETCEAKFYFYLSYFILLFPFFVLSSSVSFSASSAVYQKLIIPSGRLVGTHMHVPTIASYFFFMPMSESAIGKEWQGLHSQQGKGGGPCRGQLFCLSSQRVLVAHGS
jgi:hypothetical protein